MSDQKPPTPSEPHTPIDPTPYIRTYAQDMAALSGKGSAAKTPKTAKPEPTPTPKKVAPAKAAMPMPVPPQKGAASIELPKSEPMPTIKPILPTINVPPSTAPHTEPSKPTPPVAMPMMQPIIPTPNVAPVPGPAPVQKAPSVPQEDREVILARLKAKAQNSSAPQVPPRDSHKEAARQPMPTMQPILPRPNVAPTNAPPPSASGFGTSAGKPAVGSASELPKGSTASELPKGSPPPPVLPRPASVSAPMPTIKPIVPTAKVAATTSPAVPPPAPRPIAQSLPMPTMQPIIPTPNVLPVNVAPPVRESEPAPRPALAEKEHVEGSFVVFGSKKQEFAPRVPVAPRPASVPIPIPEFPPIPVPPRSSRLETSEENPALNPTPGLPQVLPQDFRREETSNQRSSQPTGPAPFHSYTTDFEDHVQKEHASVFSILAKEKDASRAPLRASRRAQNWPLIVGGIALVLVGFGGVYAAYRVVMHAPVVSSPTAPSLIFADERVELSGSGPDLLQALADKANQPLVSGNVLLTYITVSTTTKSGVVKTPQAGGALIQALGLPAPDILLRNTEPVSTVGIVHAGAETRPFFILRVSSYERTFAGMLAWEPTMAHDLALLYPAYQAPEVATTSAPIATTTVSKNGKKSTIVMSPAAPPVPPAAPTTFFDAVVANHDTRVLRDAYGRSLMVYGYRDKETLIIARDEAAFTELLNRLNSANVQ